MHKYLPFIMYYGSAFVFVYTFFDKWLQVGSSDLTMCKVLNRHFLQFLKLKNNDNDKNWGNELFLILSTMFVVKFKPILGAQILSLAIILQC